VLRTALTFAIVYALPELTLFFAWSTLGGLAYSAFFGAAMAVAANRMTGAARMTAIVIGGVIFSFPLPMMLPLVQIGARMDLSGVVLGRAIWFAIATAILLAANEHFTNQRTLDRQAEP
jgi:hypothetical protein